MSVRQTAIRRLPSARTARPWRRRRWRGSLGALTSMANACVVYTRVSTTDQAAPGHFSLDAQAALCRQYATAHQLTVLEVLRDEGYSGRTTSRPGLRRLLEYSSPHPPKPIHAILVQDTSRVGRDTTEYLIFRRQLQERGITLVAVTQPNIDASPEGRLVDTILAGVNQYQSEEKARRILIAMEKKFEQGGWPGWAPLGYLNVIEGEKRFIVPDPEKFELVRLAFREYATGHYTQAQLRQFLTKKSLRDRNGRTLSRTSLNKLLKNPFYYGRMRWRGSEREGSHPAVTDRQTWERCQAVTASHNRYATRSRKHVFLLSGLLVCDACGTHLTQSAITRKAKHYYNCPSRMHCPQPFIPEDTMEEQAAGAIRAIRLSDAFIEDVLAKVRDVFAARASERDRELQGLLRRRTVAEQKRTIAEEKLVAGVLSDEAFRRMTAQVNHDLDEVGRRLDELEQMRRLNTDALQEVLRLARDIPGAYADAPPSLKRRYLEFFFQAIIVRDRKIVRTIPTEFFEVLLGSGRVQKSAKWWTGRELNPRPPHCK